MNAEDSIDEELLRAISNPQRLRETHKHDSSDDDGRAIDVTDLLYTVGRDADEDVEEGEHPIDLGMLLTEMKAVSPQHNISPPPPSVASSHRSRRSQKFEPPSVLRDDESPRGDRHDAAAARERDLYEEERDLYEAAAREREEERRERRARKKERRAQREARFQEKSESSHVSYQPPPKPRGQQMYEEEIQQSVNDFTHFRKDNQRETEAIEKVELLSRMNQLEREGFPPIKRMTTSTPLDEIRYELYRQLRDSDREKGLKSMRGYLVTGASLIEMFNTTFNPFDLRLDGFSTSIMMQAQNNEFDSTLAELHHKYSGRGSGMAPELRLAMSLAFAVIVHHTSTAATQSKTMGSGAASMNNVAGGGAKQSGGMFGGGLSPFSLLASLFGNKSVAVPATSIPTNPRVTPVTDRRPMAGPDSD